MTRYLLLTLPLLLMACSGQETTPPAATTAAPVDVIPPPPPPRELVFPDRQWATARPAEVDLDSTALAAALDFLAGHCGADGTAETMVIRDGKVVWRGEQTDKVHDVWSCTKSFTSTLAGMLEADGTLDLEAPLARYEPLLEELYPTATARHFLTMTSGYDAAGKNRWGEPSADWSVTPFEPTTPLFAPGTAFAYWDEAMIVFGRALTKTLGTSLENYAAEKLMTPIGIRDWQWWSEEALPDGTPVNFGGTGLKLCAEDHARFGLLFLADGRWGEKQILPRGWVGRATVNQVPADLPTAATDRRATTGSGRYGYNWWVIRAAAGVSPVNAYFTSGLNHNVCLVVPAWNLVLVRQGTDGNPAIGKHRLYSELLARLAPAIKN